jgi:hypothetical protein
MVETISNKNSANQFSCQNFSNWRNQMKFKTLVVACALAITGQAFAAPWTTAPGTDPVATAFVSGSSALQFSIGATIEQLLDPTTISVYYDGTVTTTAGVTTAKASGSNYRAYFGKASAAMVAAHPSLQDPAAAAGVGMDVLVLETAKGGSIMGVTPVARQVVVNSLSSVGCVLDTTGKTDGSAAARVVYSCPAVEATRVPSFGISDVEPALLQVPANIPSGSLPADATGNTSYVMTAAEAVALTAKPAIGQTMGVVIGTNSTTTNLTKAQIAGLLSGSVLDWHKIDPSVASKTKTIVICRRQAGSGTHATLLARVLGTPCSSSAWTATGYTGSKKSNGVQALAMGTATPVPAGSYVVVENSSAGAMAACMNAAVSGTGVNSIDLNGGAIAATPATPIATSVVLPAGNIAIGELGLDRPIGGADLFAFLSINGILPTNLNAQAGLYDVTVESTFNTSPATPAAGTAAGDIIAAFMTQAGNPTNIAAGGVVGVMGLSENGYIAVNPDSAAYPVMRAGNGGDNCKAMVQKQ